MIIGVPREIKDGEYRVGMTPEGVAAVVARGHQVLVQCDAGARVGFADADYTWNLWPRDALFSGNASISDFAPDASNAAVTSVPEPQSYALMLVGLTGLAMRFRRRDTSSPQSAA